MNWSKKTTKHYNKMRCTVFIFYISIFIFYISLHILDSFPYEKHLSVPLGTLFSEELLQRRDVVSLSFRKLYIPYGIGA
jgi:hypothetical protein